MSQPAIATRTFQRLAAARAPALLVSSIWLTHGFYNKLLGGAPRHLAIVQAVPGFEGTIGEYVLVATGLLEVVLAVWVFSAWKPYSCAAAQTVTLLSMNALELTYARHLLLWPEGLLPLNTAFLLLAWTAAAAARHAAAEPAAAPAFPADRTRSGGDHTRSSPARRLRARLRRHPFPIEAHFDWCLTLTYALPADRLRRLLPPGLELDTRDGYGFLAVALVQTRSLRPAGLPEWLGQNFFLAGYRVFSRFRQGDGRVLRGLRILRSDADRIAMVAAGNLLTHYNYTPCTPVVVSGPQTRVVTIETHDGTGNLHIVAQVDDPSLPAASPFTHLRQARCFAGPMPFTFDYEPEAHGIVVVGSRRANWAPRSVRIDADRVAFFDAPAFAGCMPVLASAFLVENVEYRWERGVLSPLPGSPPGGAA